jgi:hypothetical protein
MPSVIHFTGGTDLYVEDDAGNVVSYLRSGWGDVRQADGGKAHVNGANVLYVEDLPDRRTPVS